MTKNQPLSIWSRTLPAALTALTLAVPALSANADVVLGPGNSGFEHGGQSWNSGGTGGTAGSVSFANSPNNGLSAAGTNCVLETSDGNGQADLRCDYFSLGAATHSLYSVSVDFDYNILGAVYSGDQIRVGLRFEDANGGFLGEYNFHIGSPNGDVGGEGWKHFSGVAFPTATAVNADIRVTMNIFGDDKWMSGDVLYDNFSVKVTPVLGPANPGFEKADQNWHWGGPGGAAGSVSFANSTNNGPSVAGTNCLLLTSDGSMGTTGHGVDYRVDDFSLGAAAQGANMVQVDFDYNILSPIYAGDQVRVGLRFLDSGGGWLGENNFHIGSPNGDMGAEGWKHFSGVALPGSTAPNADIRVSMNTFGDDSWMSGDVLFDNFSVKVTRLLGPANPGFEFADRNWHWGGSGGTAGSVSFANASTNGPTDSGTNCLLLTSDGSGNVDFRVDQFYLGPAANGAKPVTVSFDYYILSPVHSGNQIRVGLRFLDSGGGWLGENNFHIGTPNGDVGAQGWKHFSGTATSVSTSPNADFRVSMNIFGDDTWSSGGVLFDNFKVVVGGNTAPAASNLTMGTVTNRPVTWTVIGGSQGAADADGDLTAIAAVSQPSHGIVTTDGQALVYVATNKYTGADQFTYSVSDSYGGWTTATNTVQVSSTAGTDKFVSSIRDNSGNSVLTFSGAASCRYVLEGTSSLTAPVAWTPQMTNAANTSGSVVFTAPQSGAAGFWRARLLP